ncbi:MAG: hypothetical protein V1676_03450 [Candidatus Diapherotrites archaeon]
MGQRKYFELWEIRLFSLCMIMLMVQGVYAYPVLFQDGSDSGGTNPADPFTASPPSSTEAQANATDATEPSFVSGDGTIGGDTGADAGMPSLGTGKPCETKSLTPEESQNIMNLLKDGYVGREISSGAQADTDRDKLEQNKIVLTDPGRELGDVKKEITDTEKPQAAIVEQPNEKFDAWEISQFLNNSIKGAFAYGIVLEDSLRTARCEELSDPKCSVSGANLKYRNSGAGIKADFVNVWKSMQNLWEGDVKISAFTDEENDILKSAFQGEDKETFNMKVAQRLQSDLIKNSIRVKGGSFEAKLATNCTSSACVLSTYSMFDKYFNSWMSSELTVSNFGPELLYRSKKLFGWVGRRSFLKGTIENYLDKFRRKFESPGSFISNFRMDRAQANIDKFGFRKFFDELTNDVGGTANAPIFMTNDFQAWWNKMSSPGGYLDSINSLERKHEFVKIVKDFRTYIGAGEANSAMAERAYAEAVKAYGPNSGVARQAYVDYGRQFARWLNQMDDGPLRPDAPFFFVRHPNSQLYNYGVRQMNSGEVIDLYENPRHIRRIMDKFVDDGDWKGFMDEAYKYQSTYETVVKDGIDTGYIQLYKFDVSKADLAYKVHVADVDKLVAQVHENVWVNLPQHGWVRLNQGTADMVKHSGVGEVEVYKGGWAQAEALTPESFSARLTNARVRNNIRVMNGNMDQILGTLKERNWAGRRYWSFLDKLMAQEDELIKSYFSIKGGIKWTAYPFGYWWVKKGFGVESISQYQLPDTWKELSIYQGNGDVYDDAYIDFFANEGSDQGDIFVQVLNYLPWAAIMNEVSGKFNPLNDMYQSLTKNELRSTTEDLALYSSTAEECAGCTLTLKTTKLQDFSPFFQVNAPVNNYILEDTRTDEAKEKGQTIIIYEHHSNLKGETSGDNTVAGGKIDLVEAKQEETTCSDALRKLFKDAPIGIPFYDVPDEAFAKLGSASGGLLAGMEAITYLTFSWGGIFSTVAIQTLIAPKLQDCVDYDEGYYVHYFVPVREKEGAAGKEGEQTTAELSTQKVQDFVAGLNEKFKAAFAGQDTENDLTKEAAEKLGAEIDKFANNATDSDIVQATLTLQGRSSGQVTGRKLFYFWCGAGCEMHASEYKTEGKAVTKDSETGTELTFDFAQDKLLRDGKPIVESPDFTRMADVFNSNGPFQSIPRRLTVSCLPAYGSKAMEINARGEATVLDQGLLKCIQDGVLAQTGLPLEGENLSQAFGNVETVVSSTHPNIKPMQDSIVAEGVPRRAAEGSDAKVILSADNQLNLSKSSDGITDVGTLKSIIFANGSMVVKPDGCIIIWLRHHAAGILGQNDAQGLRTQLTDTVNPETGCPEPALNFEVMPNDESDYSKAKVEAFNKSLGSMGPFQIFETEDKRYVLYSGTYPECQPFLRVIDKATGKYEDYAINDLKQTPTGISFTDQDGQQHTLDFGVKDGIPQVSFDNKPETLLSAQGRNGSFWYDPEKGLWYAENAQLLPLLEAFRDGIATKVAPNGEVTSTASGNVLNLNLGSTSPNLLDLPSLPEEPGMLLLFLLSLLGVMVAVRSRRTRCSVAE